MSDLVSRAALLAEYDKRHVGPPGGARKLIEEAPAVDAVPVVHGRWESVEAKPRLIYSCSVCGEKWAYGAIFYMKYCPNCGAKMDGERKDDDTD